MYAIDILFMGIVTGFLSRYFSAIADNLMHYTEIFGFIRFKWAKLIAPKYITASLETLPDDYDNYNIYMRGVYSEVCKVSKPFRLINCQYCMSFWFLFMFIFIVGANSGITALYLLTSIAFNHVWFKL
jgi:hypothetical protein